MSHRARQTADRFGYQLAILVLVCFAGALGLAAWLAQQTLGGVLGWVVGALVAAAVAQVGGGPCGLLAWHLVNGRSW